METTLLTASFLRAWYPQRYPTSPHLCQSDAVKYFRCQKGLLPAAAYAFEYAAAFSFQQPPMLVRVPADTVWTNPTQAGL